MSRVGKKTRCKTNRCSQNKRKRISNRSRNKRKKISNQSRNKRKRRNVGSRSRSRNIKGGGTSPKIPKKTFKTSSSTKPSSTKKDGECTACKNNVPFDPVTHTCWSDALQDENFINGL